MEDTNLFNTIKPQSTKCEATYIWIDGTGEHLRSKMQILPYVSDCVEGFVDG